MCIILSAILAGPLNLRKTSDTTRSVGNMLPINRGAVPPACSNVRHDVLNHLHQKGSSAAHLKPWAICSSRFPHNLVQAQIAHAEGKRSNKQEPQEQAVVHA